MDELTLGLIGAGAVVVGGVVVYNAWQGAKVRRKMPRPMPDEAAESLARSDADEEQCDLIVMGTHGRSGLERLLMGSVAERVLRDSACSVLVVKLPRGQPATERGDVAVAASPA